MAATRTLHTLECTCKDCGALFTIETKSWRPRTVCDACRRTHHTRYMRAYNALRKPRKPHIRRRTGTESRPPNRERDEQLRQFVHGPNFAEEASKLAELNPLDYSPETLKRRQIMAARAFLGFPIFGPLPAQLAQFLRGA